MNDKWDGWRKILAARDLDDMEVIGTGMFSIGVPVDADPEFKTYVFAAGVTHALGNNSIDYQLRKNYRKWMRRHSSAVLHRAGSPAALLREIRAAVDCRCSALSKLSLGPDSPVGRIIAANTLTRLDSCFRAAVQLVRLRLPFEAEAVVRVGFEQVGWSYTISELTTIERVEAIDTTSGTRKLKHVFPWAGRIYGRLSDLAHMALHTHGRVVISDGERLKIEVKSTEAARESAFLLVVLLDAFLVTSEICFAPAGIKYESVDLRLLR